MQYENWEFDLEPMEFEGFNVKYRYIKDGIPTVLGITVQDIYLYFNFDVVFKVEIMFKN
ncbi:MAG: hypothetical protein KDC90_00305 [Ignavibacteriae bacterium]|nr:hypothetical protein [Ignavibacteriota bacterium]